MDNVLLHDANVSCVGSRRDEKICDEVVEVLSQLGYNPAIGERYKRRRLLEGIDTSRSLHYLRSDERTALEITGRWAGSSSNAESSCQLSSSSDTASSTGAALERADAVRRCDRLSIADRNALSLALRTRRRLGIPQMKASGGMLEVMQRVAPQPGTIMAPAPFKEDARTLAKDRAGSSKNVALLKWMQTDAGKEWDQKKRKRQDDTGVDKDSPE